MFPKLTKTEYKILDLLRHGQEMYGLEMVKASEGKLKRGTVYVMLGRMEEKKFITSRAEENPTHSGLPRRQYKIAGQGQTVLSAVDAANAAMSGEAAYG